MGKKEGNLSIDFLIGASFRWTTKKKAKVVSGY